MAKQMSKIQRRLAGLPATTNRFPNTTIVLRKTEQEVTAEQAAWDNPRRVIFMSRDDAKAHTYNSHEDVLISISDTGVAQPAITSSPKDILAIDFHDHIWSDTPKEAHWYMIEQAEQVAQFVHKHTDIRNILVHCNYGESRSKAMALAISKMTGRSIMRSTGGSIRPYKTNDDVGNHRVYSLTMDMLLRCSEKDAA